MKEKILQYSEQLLGWVQAGAEVIKDETVLLVKEILMFYTVYHGALTILGLVFLLIGVKAIKLWKEAVKIDTFEKLYKPETPEYVKYNALYSAHGDDFPYLVAVIGIVAPFVIGTVIFFANVFDLVKVTLAPRLYLIEFLSELVKSTGGQ